MAGQIEKDSSPFFAQSICQPPAGPYAAPSYSHMKKASPNALRMTKELQITLWLCKWVKQLAKETSQDGPTTAQNLLDTIVLKPIKNSMPISELCGPVEGVHERIIAPEDSCMNDNKQHATKGGGAAKLSKKLEGSRIWHHMDGAPQ